MSGFTSYSLIYAAIDSTTLTEEAKISFKRTSGGKAIETLALGFAGVSKGASLMNGQIFNMIPAQSGLEFDAGPYIASLQPVSMKIVRSDGAGLVFQAVILDDDTSHGVGSAASYVLNFLGYLNLNSWS